MGLKRKRSSSELCSSPSSSVFSSPPGHGTFTMDVTPCIFNPRPCAPAHLPSRTMKRFRDSRPSETIIHERTLNLLYNAQTQQPQSPQSSIESTTDIQTPQATSSQQSLHSFWNINSRPVPEAPIIQVHRPATPQSCQDCGAGTPSNVSDDSMQVDGCENQSSPCLACGKNVCFSCSVSNLGEQRHCLRCAGRVW